MDWSKPTVQMLGRWQPWHQGHTELFKRCHAITGQVAIMVRDVGGKDAGVAGQNDNPFVFKDVSRRINIALTQLGYGKDDFEVILVPNIVNISYGRGVGYTFTEHDLGEAIHNISATKIRAEMRANDEIPEYRQEKFHYMYDEDSQED